MLLIFVTLLLAQQAFADVVSVKDCGSGLGIIQSVNVAGCSGSTCNLKIGADASMALSFTSGVDTSRLTSKVAGVILGLEVPFPLPEPNSCLLGAFCPIKYGDLNTISISLPILPIYPAISVTVKWKLLDERDRTVACFTLPVKLVK